jgi:hypothetical protein
MNNFFAELKRRNVYKIAVAYAVAAWLLIQAASIFLPAFDAPPWYEAVLISIPCVWSPLLCPGPLRSHRKGSAVGSSGKNLSRVELVARSSESRLCSP